MESRIPQQYAEKYLLGGKARVVFFNTITNEQRRFAIIQWKGDHNKYQVYASDFDLKSLGTITRYDTLGGVFMPSKTPTEQENVLILNFNWVWKHIKTLTVPDTLHILHLGRCSVCGRRLTDAVSIERGIGPYCAGLK